MLVVSAFMFLSATVSVAQDSWGYDIAHDLMSPYCPGRTLATCPSPQAAELVQWIVLQESGGATQEQVIEMLVERFGEDILGAPKAEGSNLLAYILPVLAFLVCGGIAFVALRRIVGGGGLAGQESAIAGDAAVVGGAVAAQMPVLDGPPKHEADDDDDLARIVDGDLDFRA